MTKEKIGACVLVIAVLLFAGSFSSIAFNVIQSGEAAGGRVSNDCVPLSASGNNVYVSWVSNKTGNWDVMFRVSDDNGKSFGDKINLSNTTDKRSDAAHISALEDNVYLTWWETSKNGTTVPVFRASNNNGETFGPVLNLPANGTIGEG